MRKTVALYVDSHLTHKTGITARSGGVVQVLDVNKVRTVAKVAFGGHVGYVKYNDIGWL
jgi:hypothetical protein